MRHVPFAHIPFAFTVTAVTALALAACDLDHEQLRATSSPRHPLLVDAMPVQAAPPSPDVDTGLPDSLRCVSEPLANSSDILRVDLSRGMDGTFTASVTQGPQFWSHQGQWFGANGEAWPTAVQRVLSEEKRAGLVERTAAGTLTIALKRQGSLFTGTFEDSQCYVHTEATLTCWNDGELFGSPWAGIEGALDAHFDWTTGACANSDGEAARNHLPLAIVRETGFAECATLTGRLNGDDFNEPDLVGWNLAGANLDDAELFFASLTSATLNGADLGGLEFGYATVNGSFDDNTTRPEIGECGEIESAWGGTSLECVR